MTATCFILLSVLARIAPLQSAEPEPIVIRSSPATTQPIGPDISADEVISAFLAHVAASGYPQQAKDFVAASRKTTPPEQMKDFINNSLAVLSPEFKAGLELLEQERPADGAAQFTRLSESDDPYLAVASTSLAAGALIEHDRTTQAHELLKNAVSRFTPITSKTLSPDHFEFMLGYCQIHELDYDGALATLTDFLRRYPAAPERLRVTATQIVTEISRRVPGKLGDVRDLMNAARRDLAQGNAGDKVGRRQNEAVALLDKLIKEAEEKEKSDNDSKNSGGKNSNPSDRNQPSQGAKQSNLPRGGEKETVLRQTRASPGETWGRMPPKEREEILQNIQKQFPSRYRELLEQYYQQLAKDKAAP